MAKKKNDNTVKKSIIDTYIRLYKENGSVSFQALKIEGFNKDNIRYYFGSLSNLDKESRKKYPSRFRDVYVEELITQKSKKRLNNAITNCNRFVITTAVTGCPVDERALTSVKHYCEKNKAKLLVLVCSDPAQRFSQKGGYGTIDKKLSKEIIITEDTELNSNLFLSTIKTTAKQIDPTTGLARIGQKDGSFIYASPKQRLRIESTSNTKLPHAIMTTGAITKPSYVTDRYMSERLAYIAEYDHKMGGLIVEIGNDVIFHYRQIQFDSQGRFADLGTMYYGNRSKKYNPEVLIPGDWHAGETDPQVAKTLFGLIKTMKPKKVVLHDGFNGMSINHHEKGNIIKRAQRAELKQTSLNEEIQNFASDLEKFTKVVDEVIVVKSNHDEFLSRYLAEGKFLSDPHNLRLSLELSIAMIDELDPLKFGVEKTGIKNQLKIKWLKRDEDFKVAGIQLGAHGDKGANGSRGSIISMEKAYGKCVTAHSHTPGILRDAWAVGTSSYLRLSYNEGPSSWLQTSCLVYPNGMRQLINIIDGNYKLK